MRARFVPPMAAEIVQRLPEGDDWLYEVKFDGYRCLAGRDAAGVTLWSRREKPFTKQFTQSAEACGRLPPNPERNFVLGFAIGSDSISMTIDHHS